MGKISIFMRIFLFQADTFLQWFKVEWVIGVHIFWLTKAEYFFMVCGFMKNLEKYLIWEKYFQEDFLVSY